MTIDLPQPLRRLARFLPAPIYVVGGYVRNALLWGKPVGTDVDICGALTVAQIQEALSATQATVIPVNPRVGTVLIQFEGQAFEYTTFRRDSYPIGGVHTPDRVTFVSSVEEDALRRDFKANAVYLEVLTGAVLDPTGGLKDIADGIISTTRRPQEVFAEDGLRILRLARFCAELEFQPDPAAFEVAKAMCAQLADISPERKREELDRILLSDAKYGVKGAWQKGVDLLSALGAWQYLYLRAPQIAFPDYPPRLDVRLAALFGGEANGANASADAASTLGRNGLRYANRTVLRVCKLLSGRRAPTTIEAWRLWAATYGDCTDDICALWQDEDLCKKARSAYADLQAARVPLTHKDLPLTPAQIEALGVPKNKLAEVMRDVIDRCIVRLLRPCERQCIQIINEIKRENAWN